MTFIKIAEVKIQQGIDSNQALMESYQAYIGDVKNQTSGASEGEYNHAWLETMKKHNLKYRAPVSPQRTTEEQTRQDLIDTLREFSREFKES